MIVSSRKSKLRDSFFSSNLESIDRYYRRTDAMNQLIEFIFQKHHQKKNEMEFFETSEKVIYLLSFIRTKYYELLRIQRGPSSRIREGAGPVEFLHFHIYNLVHPIITGTNPIQNMNHKRKYLLNRSQEYQLPYLLSKEESFQ